MEDPPTEPLSSGDLWKVQISCNLQRILGLTRLKILNTVHLICYHFTNSWEQFRIHGTLDLIGHADYESARKSLREKAWFDSSPRARAAFAAPHPGHPKGSEPSEGNLQVDPNQGPLDTFCVLTLDPEEIDYYHAKDAVRILFKSSTTEIGHKVWSQQELNP
ncbi:pyridoxine/pyridoxamine 5'-phosphate oxidase 2 isoform X3 [Physcomitrium patens]|uniref:pyridoxine/pyridoxamine 5'-phosphate oxidase 2 isoform X3 n=1 Tax=Physcomitrium patens TaxID=3218 RepID=UPI000D151328|nr:pyridoxine/pyridoxamine 5'-phosphate oxidase 2-like isoform X3 [Physcomitrium patens]XP_024379699.1 pyridoxine/pyridoxamine 5'-phosphate oxidase 2-like isoform X3 [Physcomitrium patens]|eukprot:XP_024379698.1 pyridoxine/pyridoxamine 5'-phosphate oxidase 2-like isoform X3 [Physcomitrella patens]